MILNKNLSLQLISNTQSTDPSLRLHCLKKLKAERLIQWLKQLMANGEFNSSGNTKLITEAISVFTEQLKISLKPHDALNQIADAINSLSNADAVFTINNFLTVQTTAEQSAQWLLALSKHYSNTHLLLPYFLTFIKEHPDKVSLILPWITELCGGKATRSLFTHAKRGAKT